MSDAYVWIDPARRSGEPCVGGTRIPVEMVVGVVWAYGMSEAITHWPDLTRAQVLTACWYAGTGYPVRLHGEDGGYRPKPWPRADRWGEWAQAMHDALWSGRPDDVTDPPSAREAP